MRTSEVEMPLEFAPGASGWTFGSHVDRQALEASADDDTIFVNIRVDETAAAGLAAAVVVVAALKLLGRVIDRGR